MKTFLILTSCIAAITSREAPKVYDDNVASEPIRNRHPVSTRGPYKAPAYVYQPVPQPDSLMARYAQQQQVDAMRMANFYKQLQNRPLRTALIYKPKPAYTKYPQPIHRPSQPLPNNGTFMAKDENDWIPITPTVFSQRTPEQSNNVSRSGPVIYTLYGTKLQNGEKLNYLKNILLKNSNNLQSTEPTVVDENLKRNDNHLGSIQGEIIYVHPSLLRQGHGLNVKDHGSQAQIFLLNDLIGKNPNVQLEGLKRLLENTEHQYTAQNPIPSQYPQTNENNVVNENLVEVPDVSKIAKLPVKDPEILETLNSKKAITADQLNNLQKQLDDFAKMQAEELLSKAQQEAQAHVDDQHKAIAAAHLDIYRDNMYDQPQALPFVQSLKHQVLHHKPILPTPAPSQYQQVPFSVPVDPNPQQANTENHSPSSTVRPQVIQFSSTPKSEFPFHVRNNDNPFKILTPTPSPNQEIPKSTAFAPKAKPSYNYIVKNSPKYAPNHIHEKEVQLQAEKALLAQVEKQNSKILSKTLRSNNKEKLAPEINEEYGPNGDESASTLQEIVYEKKQTENIKKIYSKPAKHEEEFSDDDLQYAAKYAFGYRIKDTHDGNDFGHTEKRNGRSAEGSYDVLLPDGRRQKVSYYADDSGYHAKVTYENLAHHDH